MDPLTLFAVMSGASAVAKGVAGYSQGMTEAARLDSEARLAETQAIQRDANARDDLTRFLSTTQAARAANGLSAVSPNAMKLSSEANRIMNNDRLVQSGNDKQRAANLRAAAGGARRGASMSLLTGIVGGGIPITQRFL